MRWVFFALPCVAVRIDFPRRLAFDLLLDLATLAVCWGVLPRSSAAGWLQRRCQGRLARGAQSSVALFAVAALLCERLQVDKMIGASRVKSRDRPRDLRAR